MIEMSEQAVVELPVDAGVAKYATDDVFDTLAKTNDFLPRLQLYTGSSDAINTGTVGVGCFGYVKNKTIVDLGKEIRGFVLAYRPKAMFLGGAKPVAYFNPTHPEFLRFKELSKVKDSKALVGPEFLMYLSEQDLFVTFFMANKTMRREAPNVKEYCPKKAVPADPSKNQPEKPSQPAKPLTLRSTLIQNEDYSWHGPVSSGCSIPLKTPDQELLLKIITAFNNPPEMAKEEQASAAEAAATQRDR